MKTKYPRTYHLPFSREVHSDDKTISSKHLNNFVNREVVVTEKLDGGNTFFKDGVVYARSHSSPASHPSFNPIKNMYYEISHLISKDLAIYGENLYGIHTLEYDNLDSFFYVFNMTKRNVILSWDDIEKESLNLGLRVVPIVFRGAFKSIKEIELLMDKEMKKPSALGAEKEGFVIRIADSFDFNDFDKYAAKYVREGHVQTDERWEKNWRAAKLKT